MENSLSRCPLQKYRMIISFIKTPTTSQGVGAVVAQILTNVRWCWPLYYKDHMIGWLNSAAKSLPIYHMEVTLCIQKTLIRAIGIRSPSSQNSSWKWSPWENVTRPGTPLTDREFPSVVMASGLCQPMSRVYRSSDCLTFVVFSVCVLLDFC